MTREANPGSGRQSPSPSKRRRRVQAWVPSEVFDVVTALAAQRRQSHSKVAGALIAAALKDMTNG
jgi:hypothetical protein